VSRVFISYERGSEASARKVAAALRAAGHEPWSDADLPLDRPYAEVIEERLAGAERVLVLWTAAAARSQWVRAEAEFARERGKLVQARLDGALPPMPFNQIQCGDLAGWSGDRRNGDWRKLLASLDQPPGEAQPPAQPAPRRRPWRAAAAGIVLVVLAAAGGWWVWKNATPSAPPRLAVLPFEAIGGGPEVRAAADGIGDQILTALNGAKIPVVSHDEAAGLRGAGHEAQLRALGVALVFDGSVRGDGQTLTASVHLDDPFNHVTLWSGGGQGPVDQSAPMQDRVARTLVNVMACSLRALQPRHGLHDPALLTRYLRACDIFANQDVEVSPNAIFELLSNLRLISAKAPDFTAAHTDLAKFDAYLAPTLPPEQGDPLRAEAAAEAKTALAIDAKAPDAYLAQAMLLPPTAWAEREALLRKGVAADPDWPHTNGFLFQFLEETGRSAEAGPFAARAAAADLQIDWSNAPLESDCGLGRFDAALEGLKRLYERQPKSVLKWLNYFECLVEAGHWPQAAALLVDPASPSTVGAQDYGPLALKALISKAPADSEAVRQAANAAKAAGAQGGFFTADSIHWLVILGDLDDAFALAERFQPGHAAQGSTTAFLFSPQMAPFRRDPRFIRLAARLGLAGYWTAGGKWPDYCAEPGLPYDCKAEAARWLKGKV
jgi:adenylate cyclase